MLEDMIVSLKSAIAGGNKKKIESAYRQLEKVGIDRYTAMYLARKMKGGERNESVPDQKAG